LGHPQGSPRLAIRQNGPNNRTTTSQMHQTPPRTKNNTPPPETRVKRFQKLHGHLQFATIAIPCGKPILGQLNWYMSSASKHPGQKLVVTDALKAILRDWSALIRLVGGRPTHVTELVKHPPAYQGFVDASKMESRRGMVRRYETTNPNRKV
jgi:hypothetical protein